MTNEEKILDAIVGLLGGFSPYEKTIQELVEVLGDMIGDSNLYNNWLKRVKDNPHYNAIDQKWVKYNCDMLELEYYKSKKNKNRGRSV